MNVLGILTLLITFFFGYQLITFSSGHRLQFYEKISASFPIGFSFFCIFALFLNPIFGCNCFHLIVLICVITAISLILFVCNKSKFKNQQKKLPSIPSCFALIGFICACFYLSFKAIIPSPHSILVTGENDLLLEQSYIASFAYGVNNKRGFINSIVMPLIRDNYGTSEYLTAIYSSFLKISGFSYQISLFIPTLLLLSSICLLQFSFTYRLSRSEFASILSVPTLFLTGGFGFMHFLKNNDRLNPNVDYVFFLGKEFNFWGHPLLHCILTSRIVILTMALSIFSMILLEEKLDLYAGILGIIIFIARPQTGVVFFTLFLFYNIWLYFRDVKKMIIKLMFSIGAYSIFWFQFKPKWIRHFIWEGERTNFSLIPPITFALHIFGVLFIVLIFSVKNPRTYVFLLIFFIFGIFNLQKDIRFNFFALTSVAVPLLAAIGQTGLSNLLYHSKIPELKGALYSIIIILSCFMWLSSICGLYSRLGQTLEVFTQSGNHLCEWVKENTNKTAVFASFDVRWNPAITCAGRIAYASTVEALQSAKFIPNGANEDVINWIRNGETKILADFLLISKSSYQAVQRYVPNELHPVYENHKYHLFEIKN